VAVTVAARAAAGLTPVRRDGARPDDQIFLSGPVGGSILGRHMLFEPRIETALAIRRRLDPHAMIDVSDGLAIDLARLLEASGCGAVLEEPLLEAAIHPDARRLAESDGRSPREHALHDGEDFELIVTLPAGAAREGCEQLGLLPLGRITGQTGMVLARVDGSRVAIEPRGWEHFT
jgi:thiamine-monophosphate kinase